MTYQPHTWTKGETITAQLLQNMDNGVAAAIDALESAFGSNYTMGSKEYKVNFTDLGKDISANAIQGTTLTATEAISGGTISGTTLTATATEGTGLMVSGDTNLQGTLIIGTDNTAVDTTIKGKLIVNGKYDNSSPAVREAATLEGKVNITGDTVVNGNIIVGDTTTNNSIKNKIYGTTTLFGKLEVQSNGSLTVDGNSFINSNFYHQINQVQENDGSTTWFPDSVFYAYYKTIDLGMKGEMISADQPRERIVSEENSSTINLAGTRLNISNTTTKISSSTTEIRGNLIIGDDPTNNIYTHTVTIKANSTLNGVTTIKKLDQLIVGDSTSTADNEIYGFTTINNLIVGAQNVDSGETQTYSGTATFNTSDTIFNQPASFFNNNIKTEHMEITSRSIKQSIGDQTYDLISQNGTYIYFGASNNNTFIRGSSVTIEENDLRFTMQNSTDTYTYCFANSGQAGFKLTANQDSSSSSPQPNHTLFHYIPSAFDDDMLIVGGLSNSIASTDTSLVQDVFINAEDSIILTTKNTTGIRITNDTAIVGTLKVIDTAISGVLTANSIKTTVTDESTLDGKKDYKYNYTFLTSPTLGLFALQCSGTNNSNQPLTKTPSLLSYRPCGFESESYLTIGGPSVLPSEGDNGCVEQTYIRAKDNITLSPTNSTGRVNVNSDLHIGYQKSLYINNTTLSEDDIKHLHTLWTNYGGE